MFRVMWQPIIAFRGLTKCIHFDKFCLLHGDVFQSYSRRFSFRNVQTINLNNTSNALNVISFFVIKTDTFYLKYTLFFINTHYYFLLQETLKSQATVVTATCFVFLLQKLSVQKQINQIKNQYKRNVLFMKGNVLLKK